MIADCLSVRGRVLNLQSATEKRRIRDESPTKQ